MCMDIDMVVGNICVDYSFGGCMYFCRYCVVVGVVQYNLMCVGFIGGFYGFDGVVRVGFIVVKEMFGVKYCFMFLCYNMCYGFCDVIGVFGECNVKCFFYMEIMVFVDQIN